jgi:methionyl-tRNA formyltransferase
VGSEGQELRILVCTKADLPSLIALNRLLPALSAHTVEVVLTDKTRPAERTQPELGVIKFLERDLPFRVLFPLVERSVRTGERPRLGTFAELSARHAVPVRNVRFINSGDGFALASSFAPDLVLSIRFSLLFKRPMLDLPRYGILNLHPGPLPGYGGLFAIFRQMLAGQREITMTLHQVDEGIDTGPVMTTTPMTIMPGRSMLWHVLRAYRTGVDALLDAVATLDGGRKLDAVPQDPGQFRYFRLPEPELFQAFASAGLKLYDYDEYADDVQAMFDIPLPSCVHAS